MFAGRVLAQAGGGYDLHWNVAAAGGGFMSGGGYTLNGTALQAGANPAGALGANGYTLPGGFWVGEHQNDLIFRDSFD